MDLRRGGSHNAVGTFLRRRHIGEHGALTLLDAFEGHRMLLAYYFMWQRSDACEGWPLILLFEPVPSRIQSVEHILFFLRYTDIRLVGERDREGNLRRLWELRVLTTRRLRSASTLGKTVCFDAKRMVES